MFPTFQESIDRLAQVAAPPAPLPSKRAAVVIGLRDGSAGPEILMIQRAVREGDPWSGHMGFPGGAKITLTSLMKPARNEKRSRRSVLIWRIMHVLSVNYPM